MAAEFTSNALQTVAAGQNVLFTETAIPCRKGYVIHREGAKEHMIDGLYSMMGDAQNEAERGAIQDCINRLKS